MEKLAKFIVKQRKKIGFVFLILLIISLILIPKVKINYDLSEYIPDSERAKRGMNTLEEEFAMQGYARIMINNVTLVQAKEYKDKIAAVDGVDIVLWLDDSVDVYEPIEYISEDLLQDYYKDGSALIEVMFEESEYSSKTNVAVEEIKKIIPEDSNLIGSAIDTKSAQDTVQKELGNIMVMVVPVVLIILLLIKKSSKEKQSVDPFAIMSRAQSETTSEKKPDEPTKKAKRANKDGLPPAEEDDDFFVPRDQIDQRIHTPTVDGSERGGQAFVIY